MMAENYTPDEYVNPKDFVSDLLPHYSTLILDENAPAGKQLESLIRSFVYLREDSLYPIITSYMMLSQKWSKVCPVLFCYGLPGTGKSTLSILAAYLHNQEYTFSSSDTFPSIRNALDTLRWLDEGKEYERDGAILCWDNLGADTLRRDPRLYQLLLFGYNRNTDKMMIANSDGTNKVFHVFCPKILSSVEPLHLDPEFQELHRRFLVIHHQKNEDAQLESLSDYDFSNFPKLFFDFWHYKQNCLTYVATRTSISRRKWSISETRKTVSIDLATIHSLIYQVSTDESVSLLSTYWTELDSKTHGKPNLEVFLEQFMTLEFVKLDAMNIKYLQPMVVSDYIKSLVTQSRIDVIEARSCKTVMGKLGYVLKPQGWMRV